MIAELESDCVFLHADEDVYSKILIIKWIETGDYEKIFPLLGGFHTILVFLKILHKKYGVLGLKEWWIDSEAVQPGSADEADAGKYYFRSVRLHKQGFESFIRYRIEKEIKLDPLSEQLQNTLQSLRVNQ